MLTARVCWALLGLLGATWTLGYVCAPSNNTTLASVALGPTSASQILSGRAFACSAPRVGGPIRCSTQVETGTLVIELARGRCAARIGARALDCRYGGHRTGYPSLQLDAPDVRVSALSRWQPVHLLGSLSESGWTDIALVSTIVVPLALTGVLATRAERLKRRLGFRLLLAVAAMPPLLFSLLIALMFWGYLD
jgi:hypothetical protein